MLTKTTQENRLMRAEGLLNKLKHPEEQECPWFYSDKKTFTRMKKSIEELIDGHVRADPIELSPVVHAHEGLRVNADADAYVETPQTIATKPLWIDSVANGGGPSLETQDWMDGREFSSSRHTKLLMLPPDYSPDLDSLDYCM
ncbi:hypothetical protein ACTXT7_010324 [Hymenolepis weldensis]